MTDIFGPQGDEIAAQITYLMKNRRLLERCLAGREWCPTCKGVLWQVIDLPGYRVLCTRQIEADEKPPYRVRLDRRWSFGVLTGNDPADHETFSAACRCGWTDYRLRDVLTRVKPRS